MEELGVQAARAALQEATAVTVVTLVAVVVTAETVGQLAEKVAMVVAMQEAG